MLDKSAPTMPSLVERSCSDELSAALDDISKVRSYGAAIPTHWYNVIADLPFELPLDIPQRQAENGSGLPKLQLPLALVRQGLIRQRDIAIPDPVREQYRSWRPPLGTRAPSRDPSRHEGTDLLQV